MTKRVLSVSALPDVDYENVTVAELSDIPAGGGGGTGASSALLYTLASDVSGSMTVNTWADVIANQNFTVSSAGDILLVSLNACAIVGPGAAQVGSSILIDSGGTPVRYLVGGSFSPPGYYSNAFSAAGSIWLTGLSAGTHTIKAQVIANVTGQSFYCRPAGVPNVEHFSLRVLKL